MGEVVQVTPELAIPVEELRFRVSRSGGPGGQGVNTTDSRVELLFDLAGSPSLSDEQKQGAIRGAGAPGREPPPPPGRAAVRPGRLAVALGRAEATRDPAARPAGRSQRDV